MAPFRIPFSTRKTYPVGHVYNNENANPHDTSSPYGKEKPSLALNQKGHTAEPNEFKLSSVNDSGEYLPPSPTEERGSFWSTRSPSSSHRSIFSENEPFSISRESFDSYRRSFDVTGRSPIIHSDSFNSRLSMDSRQLSRPFVTAATFEKPRPSEIDEAGFEDVGLNDDRDKQDAKKRGFLSRFGDSNNNSSDSVGDKKHHFTLLSGRKRGQSGTGSELNNMDRSDNRPSSRGKADIAGRRDRP